MSLQMRPRILLSTLAALAFFSSQASAQVQPPTLPTPPLPDAYPPTTATLAASTYYAVPSWSQKLAANVRFVVLTNWNNDAVLDRETGLIWARRTLRDHLDNNNVFEYFRARFGCDNALFGGRGGWRLPNTVELLSLVDPSVTDQPLRLPVGHPFLLPPPEESAEYWTGEIYGIESYMLINLINLHFGTPSQNLAIPDQLNYPRVALCVRGAPQ